MPGLSYILCNQSLGSGCFTLPVAFTSRHLPFGCLLNGRVVKELFASTGTEISHLLISARFEPLWLSVICGTTVESTICPSLQLHMRPTLKAHIANVHPHPFLLTCPGKLGFWPHLCRSRSSNTHSESLAVAVPCRLQKERRGQGQFTGFAHSAECVSIIIMISSFCTSRKSLRHLVPRLPTWEDYRLAYGPVNVRIFVHFLSRFIVLGYLISLAIVEKTFSKCSLDTDWSVTRVQKYAIVSHIYPCQAASSTRAVFSAYITCFEQRRWRFNITAE